MNDRGFRISGRLILGLFIIFIGLLFTLDNLGMVQAEPILRWWPAFLIALGLAKLFGIATCGRPVLGLILTFAGTWLLLSSLDVVTVSIGDFWPLLLVLLGAWLVARAIFPIHRQSFVHVDLGGGPRWGGHGGVSGGGAAGAGPGGGAGPGVGPCAGGATGGGAGPGGARDFGIDSSPTFRTFVLMSGVNRKNTSRDFRGGEATAVMGGCEIDLRDARMAGGEAVIDAFALMGGIELRVPPDWKVSGEVTPILGAFEDKTKPPAGEVKGHLIVKGLAIMGGMEVSN